MQETDGITRRSRLALCAAIVIALAAAVADATAMSIANGGGRVRDLRVAQLVRYVADLAGFNVLAHAPLWVHADRDTTTVSAWPVLIGSAAIVTFALLALPAILAAIAIRKERFDCLVLAALAFIPFAAAADAFGWRKQWMDGVTALAASLLLYALARNVRREQLERMLRHGGVAAFAAVAFISLAAMRSSASNGGASSRPLPNAPNIILISIDSLRADHLHSYGYGRATSPNIDAIAREGVVFENAIAPTSWTLPSHATLLTGLAPERHGVINQNRRIGATVKTLAQRLHERGYDTAGFVSGLYLDGMYGFSRGFDTYDDYSLLHLSHRRSRELVSAPTILGLAQNWLTKWQSSSAHAPFFLFLHFWDVHYDYVPPAPFDRRFDPAYDGEMTGWTNSPRYHAGMPKEDLEHLIALYDGEIAWTDAHIGRLMTALQRMGIDNNTIVVITSDHGEEFLDHGGRNHQNTLYDEVLHVPLIVRDPRAPGGGRRVREQVRLADVAPTLLSLAGLRGAFGANDGDAVSLAPLLHGETNDDLASLPAFGDLKGKLASVREPDAKLIVDLRSGREEFYDLRADPHEKKSLSTSSARAAALREELQRWRSTSVLPAADVHLSRETEATLKSLGYLQ